MGIPGLTLVDAETATDEEIIEAVKQAGTYIAKVKPASCISRCVEFFITGGWKYLRYAFVGTADISIAAYKNGELAKRLRKLADQGILEQRRIRGRTVFRYLEKSEECLDQV